MSLGGSFPAHRATIGGHDVCFDEARMSRLSKTVAALVTLLGALTVAPIASQAAPAVRPGEVIVRWKVPAALRAKVTTDLHGQPARLLRNLDPQTELLRLSERTAAATWAAVAALKNDPRVELVQPNFLRRIFVKPNDEHYPLQWHLPAIKAEPAWDITRGSAQVRIAVIDTGIRKDHPEFSGQLLPGYDFVTDLASAGDGGGRDGDPTDPGDNKASSSAMHGTHVAGIIGARTDNGKGVAGVCWNCKLVPVRALGVQQGLGDDADIADAIKWAAGIAVPGVPANQYPAQVINMSFGGEGDSPILVQAVQAALAKGAILVAAAGNESRDGAKVLPAAIPGVITVGATAYSGGRAPYSNWGAVIDVMAPGGHIGEKLPLTYEGEFVAAGILSTMCYTDNNTCEYRIYEGTSQAAPVVAGVVGLMVSVDPTLTPAKALTFLKQTAKPIACDHSCGAGLIDAASAVQLTLTNSGGTTAPTGNNRPFGQECTQDSQCSSALCSSLTGPSYICTQYCSSKQSCPAVADCVLGICVPFSGPTTHPGTPPGGPLVIQGVGCSMGGQPALSSGLLLSLALLGLLGLRRRRSFRPRGS